MKIYTFRIRFRDGAERQRTEWGRTRKQALKTLESVYGADNFEVIS